MNTIYDPVAKASSDMMAESQSETEPSYGANSVPKDDAVFAEQPPHLTIEIESVASDAQRNSGFLDARSLQIFQRGFGPRVNSILVNRRGSTYDTDRLLQLVTKMQDAAEQRRRSVTELQFVPQVLMSPDVEKQEYLSVLAELLLVNNEEAKRRACAVLETLLVELEQSEDTRVTEGLMKVAESTWQVFQRQIEDGRHVHVLACSHFMTVAAVLSRCPRPTCDQYFSHVQLPPQTPLKKTAPTGDSSIKDVLRTAIFLFYKTFKEQLENPSLLSNWDAVDWFLDSSQRKAYFGRSSFCEKVLYAFTIMNEVVGEGWSDMGRTMLEALRDLYESPQKTDKQSKQCVNAARVAFSFLLVRGLVVLLRNTFEADKTPVGSQRCDHIQLITELILLVIRNTPDDCQKKRLIEGVCELPFHNAVHVRQAFGCFLRTEGPPLAELALGYLENNLRVVSFQRNLAYTSSRLEKPCCVTTGICNRLPVKATVCQKPAEGVVKSSARIEACGWEPIKATVCQKPAEGAMYVPKASCMAKNLQELLECIEKHPGSMEDVPDRQLKTVAIASRHRNNLDMLKLLSLRCRNILQLWAYQIKPFPVYITESVEDRRLLGYLLNHRKEANWLPNATIVGISDDILEALLYLLQNRVINCDVTTYNMIVEDKCEIRRNSQAGPSQVFPRNDEFIIKLADLGLAHKLPRNETELLLEGEQGPIPVRWTAPEALFQGKHSERSMVYSFGWVVYELWTHGCQPFTDLDKELKTPDILSKFSTQPAGSLSPFHWPCLPADIFMLITRCINLNANDRPLLQQVRDEIRMMRRVCSQQEKSDSDKEPELSTMLHLREHYPEISEIQQSRNHVPERGMSVLEKESQIVI